MLKPLAETSKIGKKRSTRDNPTLNEHDNRRQNLPTVPRQAGVHSKAIPSGRRRPEKEPLDQQLLQEVNEEIARLKKHLAQVEAVQARLQGLNGRERPAAVAAQRAPLATPPSTPSPAPSAGVNSEAAATSGTPLPIPLDIPSTPVSDDPPKQAAVMLPVPPSITSASTTAPPLDAAPSLPPLPLLRKPLLKGMEADPPSQRLVEEGPAAFGAPPAQAGVPVKQLSQAVLLSSTSSFTPTLSDPGPQPQDKLAENRREQAVNRSLPKPTPNPAAPPPPPAADRFSRPSFTTPAPALRPRPVAPSAASAKPRHPELPNPTPSPRPAVTPHAGADSLKASSAYVSLLWERVINQAKKDFKKTHRFAGNATSTFKTSCQNLGRQGERTSQQDLPAFVRDVRSAVDAAVSVSVPLTDTVEDVTPVLSHLARRDLLPDEKKAFLRLAGDALPWGFSSFRSREALEEAYGIDIARQVFDVLQMVAASISFIDVKNFKPRHDLMASMALEYFGSAIDRVAFEGVAFERGTLTRAVHELQQREAWFDIKTSNDAVDFDRRWMMDDKKMSVDWLWGEYLDRILDAPIASASSLENITEYFRACVRALNRAFAATPPADEAYRFRVRVLQLLDKVDEAVPSWSPVAGYELHQEILKLFVVQVPQVFERATVPLHQWHLKIIKHALAFHPHPDFAGSIIPLLNSLATSGLTVKTRGLGEILISALKERRIDLRYLLDTGLLERLLLAFPMEAEALPIQLAPLVCPRPAHAADVVLPDVDFVLTFCRLVHASPFITGNKSQLIQRTLQIAIDRVVNYIRVLEGLVWRAEQSYDGARRPFSPQARVAQSGSHLQALSVVQEVKRFVEAGGTGLNECGQAEVLTSIMNGLGFCGESKAALDVYDTLRRRVWPVKDKQLICRTISVVLDVCGQARSTQFQHWGFKVWQDLLDSGFKPTARTWETYREFLARYDLGDEWLKTIDYEGSSPPFAEPRFDNEFVEQSISVAMNLMSAHNQRHLRGWFDDINRPRWFKERWNNARARTRPDRRAGFGEMMSTGHTPFSR